MTVHNPPVLSLKRLEGFLKILLLTAYI